MWPQLPGEPGARASSRPFAAPVAVFITFSDANLVRVLLARAVKTLVRLAAPDQLI